MSQTIVMCQKKNVLLRLKGWPLLLFELLLPPLVGTAKILKVATKQFPMNTHAICIYVCPLPAPPSPLRGAIADNADHYDAWSLHGVGQQVTQTVTATVTVTPVLWP